MVVLALDMKADKIHAPNIQLRTPLTRYKKRPGLPWVLDNGAYTCFDEKTWLNMAGEAIMDPNCIWFAMPDEVGDHAQTMTLFHKYSAVLEHKFSCSIAHKTAFVIQDGCTIDSVPWGEITAVFLGGTTRFKMSHNAYKILEEAAKKNKWIHIGRVNTPDRVTHFYDIADSIDGSGLAKYDHMREAVESRIKELEGTRQIKIFEY